MLRRTFSAFVSVFRIPKNMQLLILLLVLIGEALAARTLPASSLFDVERTSSSSLRRAELDRMGPSKLVRLAQSVGATERELDKTDDTVNAKGALIELILKYEKEAEGILNEANATLGTSKIPGCTPEGCGRDKGCLWNDWVKKCCLAGKCVERETYKDAIEKRKLYQCCGCTEGTMEAETDKDGELKYHFTSFRMVSKEDCKPTQSWNHCKWGVEGCTGV
mmetsp:Transcript_95002/g.148615  ORF Transcript_95002/g.148615 Transcript_95002/m.148615 type:complete len:221 (-) Transcript_95002:110-772(-)